MTDNSGWDMFCEKHFKGALERISKKFGRNKVGYCDVIEESEETDEDLRCGHPGCKSRPRHEIYWLIETGHTTSSYVPLE